MRHTAQVDYSLLGDDAVEGQGAEADGEASQRSMCDVCVCVCGYVCAGYITPTTAQQVRKQLLAALKRGRFLHRAAGASVVLDYVVCSHVLERTSLSFTRTHTHIHTPVNVSVRVCMYVCALQTESS